jgi:plasmid stabilization system protein ParE
VDRTGYRLTELAIGDVERILDRSFQTFGPAQKRRYQELLTTAFERLSLDPFTPHTLSPRVPQGPGPWAG